MDSLGSLNVRWAQGYDGSEVAFVNLSIICHACGNFIKFIDLTNNKETVYTSPGDGVGILTASASHGLVAFSEMCLNPRIFVHNSFGFTQKAVCSGGAKLEYSCIALSPSHPYMASCSAVPDFSVFLWNFETGQLLSTESMNELEATQISFNPTEWHKLCVTGPSQLQVWTIEQADTVYKLSGNKFNLPFEDGSTLAPSPVPSRPDSRPPAKSYDVDLDDAAIAGLVGDVAEEFEANFDESLRKVVPVSHCWTPTGDVYCGCSVGHLLKADTENNHVDLLVRPQTAQEKLLSQGGEDTMPTMPEDSEPPASSLREITEGSLQCIALHREGLFAGGDDGVLRSLDVTSRVVQVSDAVNIGSPISTLSWSPKYAKMVIGSTKGSVHIYDQTNPGNAQLLFDTHFGNFVGAVPLSPGTSHCVSVRDDGVVQIWSLEDSNLLGGVPIGFPVCSIAASPSSSAVAVGSLSGHIFIIDASNMEAPRVVQRIHAHRTPVLELIFDQEGRYLFSGSDDGHVFVIDARPSGGFSILGQTPIEGLVCGISTVTEEKHGSVKVLVSNNKNVLDTECCESCVYFEIPDGIYDNTADLIGGNKGELNEDRIKKMDLQYGIPVFSATITTEGTVYALGNMNKQMVKFSIPKEKPQKGDKNASTLQVEGEYPAHDLPWGAIIMSYHQKWIASWSLDGQLIVRDSDTPHKVITTKAHSHQLSGVYQMSLTTDALQVLSCGTRDETMACFSWNFTPSGKTKAAAAIEAARSHQAMLRAQRVRENEILAEMKEWRPRSDLEARSDKSDNVLERNTLLEKAMESDQIYMTPTPTMGYDPTWMEIKELEAIQEEDKQYAEIKKDLRSEIRELRRTIQTMMKRNETLPDIEKLGHHEFNLDTEEQERLQAEGDEQVMQMREDMELEDLAKMYLREMIKKECWDSMIVKGRSIKAFHNLLEVCNYPMREREKQEVEELAFITKLREVEVAEMAARKEILDVQTQQEKEKETAAAAADGDEESEEGGDGVEQPSTTGSLGAQYGGANELLYSQFELHTRQQKHNQIVLLQDCIHRIKQTFNKDFDEVYKQREQEIQKIADKNVRIRKILEDLSSNESIWQPVMDSDEKPEKLLSVDDKEVEVKKFITSEQQAKLDVEAKEEEERKISEKGDNVRDRALTMMMGGVLEIKKEDELKKDVPVPPFIVNKPQDEWNEEEQKAAKDYETKVKELNEEREKYRKTLEAELKKLQTIIADTTSNFDDKLLKLFERKLKTEMVIFQEELKILRLNYSLLVEEELDTREEELNRQLEVKKVVKIKCAQGVVEAKKMVDAYRDIYDIRVAEDKILDKNFRREFPEVHPILIDQLYKLYRRRPRIQRRDVKGSVSDVPVSLTNANPYGERPMSARQPRTTAALLKALDEFDDESHMPEGIESHVWKHMCQIRRDKLVSEQEVKAQALTLADMNAYLQHRQEMDQNVKSEIDGILASLNRLREDRMRFTCNLEVQLVLKQGQVEVLSDDFIQCFTDCVLLHRSVVEDLNASIKQLGEQKIAKMTESKDFRKGIHILEWEHKKMVMEIEDLLNKAKAIQMLKVSRELQIFLHNEDHEGRKQQEMQTLESTLENQRMHHEKHVEECKRTLSKLKHTIRGKELENAQLDKELEEMNVCVAERKHIHEVNASVRNETGAEKRMQIIVQRRKLVDLAKAQAQEIAVLRAEVERLRMRTFPALVQVEH